MVIIINHKLFFIRMAIGMIFCHVVMMISIDHFILLDKGGIHIWKGAAAILIPIEIEIRVIGNIIIIIFFNVIIFVWFRNAINNKVDADI